MGDLLDKFIAEENLIEIKKRKPGERATRKDELAFSTAVTYLSLSNRIREAWGATRLDRFKPLAFENWLKAIDRQPKTKGHLKAFVNRLFNRAKVYETLHFHKNPIELVEVRGISKRKKKQPDLTLEQCFLILDLLPEPYHIMAFSAPCSGLRIEEVLAQTWDRIDFERLCMRVEEAVVHGRIGPVKSEYSEEKTSCHSIPGSPRCCLIGSGLPGPARMAWYSRATSPACATTRRRCSRTGSGGRGGAWSSARNAARRAGSAAPGFPSAAASAPHRGARGSARSGQRGWLQEHRLAHLPSQVPHVTERSRYAP